MMNRRNLSNPEGLGFAELMLCSETVFMQVCSEIEAEHWQCARTLLELQESSAEGSCLPVSHVNLDRKS